MRGIKICLKKRKRIYFCFLMQVFLFLKHFLSNFVKEDKGHMTRGSIKIHGTIASLRLPRYLT